MNALPQVLTPLNGVVATTTSGAVVCRGAKRITLMFTRADHGSGSSAFKTQVSIDGTTFVDFNGLIDNVVGSNDSSLTRITTKTLSSNTSVICKMDLQQTVIDSFKIVVTETTDGTHTAKCLIEY